MSLEIIIMNYFDLIKQRCSYRGNYTAKKIPKQDLKLILSAALCAPTGMNAQSTEFVVVDDADKVVKIGETLEKKYVVDASAIIICIVNKTPQPVNSNGLSFEIEDCSAAVMSMLLAITELGYASVWLDGVLKRNNYADKISKIIDLPDNKKIQIILPIGEPAIVSHQPVKKSEAERVSYNSYNLKG